MLNYKKLNSYQIGPKNFILKKIKSIQWAIFYPLTDMHDELSVSSDLYEGTRMARVSDLRGIRQIILPLEMAGTLVRRSDEEVCISTSTLSSVLQEPLSNKLFPVCG